MNRLRKCWILLSILVLLISPVHAQQQAIDFRTTIQPVFEKNCKGCHQGSTPAGSLRLDSPSAFQNLAMSGRLVIPGNSSESMLSKRISSREENRMPPPPLSSLPEDQIALINRWIDQGAHVEISPSDDFFTRKVQPIFAKACYGCHSGSDPKAQFNLSIKEAALKGGVSGPAIIPGNSADSLLLRRVLGAGDTRQMPLAGKPLQPEQITILRQWIDEGAKWPDTFQSQSATGPRHWAYVKPVKPPVPQVNDTTWGRNPIDHFILSRLEKENLRPSPEATREVLIRRVSLDLIGLPPSPKDVAEFVADAREEAYERLVDRLLASPRYGERWATPWLDLARYGDSNGWRNDRQRVIWPYRDWVIKALNNNMPFDQFTIEQLAGDMLPNAAPGQKVATGFVRSSTLLDEGGTDLEENYWNAQVDRTSTVGTVWLGSSIGCAQCHDHKFDPFTQKHFYQMLAFFNNVAFVPDNRDPRRIKKDAKKYASTFSEPILDLPTPEQAKKRSEITLELKKLEARLNDSSPESQQAQKKWESDLLEFEKEWQPLQFTRVSAINGTTLALSADGSVLASGANPDTETYVLEAKMSSRQVTGIRIEALPDPSLPNGGPGRDPYGNFALHKINVEIGSPPNDLQSLVFRESLFDSEVPRIDDKSLIKQTWIVDATQQSGTRKEDAGSRTRFQLLLLPKDTLHLSADGVLRVTLVHKSEIGGLNLGRFQISTTAAKDPTFALDIPAKLRPLLDVPTEKRPPEEAEELSSHYRSVAKQLAPLRRQINTLRNQIKALGIPSSLVMAENVDVPRPSTHLHIRGAFVSKGDLVSADVPAFLSPLPPGAPTNRLGFAQWLVSRDNPLTSRVTVNHFWQDIFGRGIVETAEEFGIQGSPPSHPELLDWLAVEFMDNGWNMKALQRLIVTSSTYRQSSTVTPALLERDPANVLLTRGPRFRVEAEMVRDIAMTASGLLTDKMFGPPIMPYQPPGLWDNFPGQKLGPDEWVLSSPEDRYRRGLYIFVRRSVRYPSLSVFDAPSRITCTARRSRSNTPLQALTTLNDPAFFEAAQAMARRVIAEGGETLESRANYAFRLVVARPPNPQELDTLLSNFEKSRQYFDQHPTEVKALTDQSTADAAAWTMIANALLNLDETLTKE